MPKNNQDVSRFLIHCARCQHSKPMHFYTHRHGSILKCAYKDCNCDDFQLYKNNEICECRHRFSIHSTRSGCLVIECKCRMFSLRQTKTPPKFEWVNSASGFYYELRLPDINVTFNIYNYLNLDTNPHLTMRVKTLSKGYYSEIADVKSWEEANAVVFNYVTDKIKKTADVIKLTELVDNDFPTFTWQLQNQFTPMTHKLDLDKSFGCSYFLYKDNDKLEVWKQGEYNRTQLDKNLRGYAEVDAVVYEDIKGCLEKTIKQLKLL
jgi:hypothetical protein